MGKRTRVSLLTITVVVTIFTFCSMWLTRPGHSQWAAKVLEEAAARQSQSLVTVKEPLETDTKVLSDEEKMAEKVAALLTSDNTFNNNVKDNITADIKDELEAWKESVKSDILKEVEGYMQSYSLDEYIPAMKAEFSALIDSKFSELNNTLDNKLNESDKALDEKLKSAENDAVLYIDNTAETLRGEIKSGDEDVKALIESAPGLEAIAKEAITKLGVSDEEEYEAAIARIRDQVIEKALQSQEVEAAAVALIDNEHSKLMEGYEAAPVKAEEPAVVEEVAPAKEAALVEEIAPQEETVPAEEAAPVKEAAPKKVTVPTFSTQSQNLTQSDYKAERAKRRSAEINAMNQWLSDK